MNREPVNPDDPQLTAYALGEMPAHEAVEFEARLKSSPLAKAELEEMSDIVSMLSVGLKKEWENQSPTATQEVSIDDPELTAFSLGEMTSAESVVFESRLEESPSARKELSEMSEIMSMLSTGLRNEWATAQPAPALEALDSPAVDALESPAVDVSDDVVIPFNFRESRKAWLGMAAAAVAMLVATYSIVDQGQGRTEVADWGSGSPVKSVDSSIDNGEESFELVGVTSAPGVQVPQLFLAEEIDDLSQLDLAGNWEVRGPKVLDASYLNSKELVSEESHQTEMRIVPASYSPGSVERIDSYLPPVVGNRKISVDGKVGAFSNRNEGAMVLVDYRPDFAGGSLEKIDHEIRLSAEFQGIQSDLRRIVSSMPEGTSKRRELELILERNHQALGELKQQFIR